MPPTTSLRTIHGCFQLEKMSNTKSLDLVVSVGGEVRTDTLKVAAKFGMRHDAILRALRNIQCSADFRHRNFAETHIERKMPTGGIRKDPLYTMTRDGFTFLAMGFTGSKAAEFKEAYINQFNAMERELIKQQFGKKDQRQLCRVQRYELTDKIAEFVEYAKAQGSKSADMYYSSVTMMEYRALNFIAGNPKCAGLRDLLSTHDLGQLIAIEGACLKAIEQGMNDGLHYKEIFVMAKNRCFSIANVLGRLDKPFLLTQKKD